MDQRYMIIYFKNSSQIQYRGENRVPTPESSDPRETSPMAREYSLIHALDAAFGTKPGRAYHLGVQGEGVSF